MKQLSMTQRFCMTAVIALRAHDNSSVIQEHDWWLSNTIVKCSGYFFTSCSHAP